MRWDTDPPPQNKREAKKKAENVASPLQDEDRERINAELPNLFMHAEKKASITNVEIFILALMDARTDLVVSIQKLAKANMLEKGTLTDTNDPTDSFSVHLLESNHFEIKAALDEVVPDWTTFFN